MSVNILMRKIILILGIFVSILGYNNVVSANILHRSHPFKLLHPSYPAEIHVISQNVQRDGMGKLFFTTTYTVKNNSPKAIQRLVWYAVYIFNNRIIDNHLVNLEFNQFNILKPNQSYYLSTHFAELDMSHFSKPFLRKIRI